MWSAALELTTGAAFVAHASLVPAGGGMVAALLAPGGGAPAVEPSVERVTRLRALASAARLAEPAQPMPGRAAAPAPPRPVRLTAGLPTASWVQLAAVCTVASAVVHACAGPHHATEHLAFGLFFYVVAFVQFAWTAQVLLSPPTPVQLRRALWLNVLLILLWAVTRTVGLPGVLDGPEEMGAWDLAAKVWELGAAACCVVLLRHHRDEPTDHRADHRGRGPLVRTPVLVVAGVSVLVLVGLAMSGQPQ